MCPLEIKMGFLLNGIVYPKMKNLSWFTLCFKNDIKALEKKNDYKNGLYDVIH